MLDHYVTIYHPSTLHDQPAPDSVINESLDSVIQELSIQYGGCTVSEAIGGWYSTDLGKVIREKVYLCKSFSESVPARAALIELCEKLKGTFQQEAISLEIDGILEFI